MMFAYHGRYLRIDPRDGRSALVPIEESVLRRYLGGVGLGTWIVSKETPPKADPLGPDAAIVFALSPLVGTPLTTSAKFAVVAISPLTGRLCDALSSSHFAITAKRSGVDAIALSGAYDGPVVIFVDGMGRDDPVVTVREAQHLWGLPSRGPRRKSAASTVPNGRSRASARPERSRSRSPRSATTAVTPAGADWGRSLGRKTSRRWPCGEIAGRSWPTRRR